MVTNMVSAKTTTPAITEKQIEDCIREFLGNDTSSEFTNVGQNSPLRPVVDSLVVAELLVHIEAVVGSKLPVSVIRRGGYYSVDDAVAHLVPRIMDELS